jgi:superoxide reductase
MTLKPIQMDRRGLAKAAFLGAAVTALPALGRAQAADPAANLVFTADDPGHWAVGKRAHLPLATVDAGVLTVKTPHPMSELHFIVSHTVVLAGGQYLGRKTFTPTDMPVSTYTLPAGYTGKVTVTSTCNLHDFWTAAITV